MFFIIYIFVLSALLGAFLTTLLKYKKKASRLQEDYDALLQKHQLQFDLELATSDQLLTELRSRPQPPYILLLPVFEQASISLQMEIHNLPPDIAIGLLKLAYKLSYKQENGQETVELDFDGE